MNRLGRRLLIGPASRHKAPQFSLEIGVSKHSCRISPAKPTAKHSSRYGKLQGKAMTPTRNTAIADTNVRAGDVATKMSGWS